MRYRSMLPDGFQTWDPLSRAQYTEMNLFLSNYLLSSQGDRMAMAHSVEGRFPFLDYRVVEFACRVPPRYRMNGLKEKFLLRRAAADLIPDELAQRPKQPYRAPISRSFLSSDSPDYVGDLLSEQSVREAGYFDPIKVTRLVQKGEIKKASSSANGKIWPWWGFFRRSLSIISSSKTFGAFLKRYPKILPFILKNELFNHRDLPEIAFDLLITYLPTGT